MTDLAFKFTGQLLDRGEDSAGNDIALDLGEPVFYLIEPGGVGRGVMEMNFGVSREELSQPVWSCRPSTVVGVQARQPLGFKTTLPVTDSWGCTQRLANRQVEFALRLHHDHSRAAHILGWPCARTHPIPQFRALTIGVKRNPPSSMLHDT